MPTIELTDEQYEQLVALHGELKRAHEGPYTTVPADSVVTYLFDLAAAVDDPDRLADPSQIHAAPQSFPSEHLREQLSQRVVSHDDPDAESELDLQTIAARYDISGYSSMKKAELIDAIVDRIETVSTDPLALIDMSIDSLRPDTSDARNPFTETEETDVTLSIEVDAADDADVSTADADDDSESTAEDDGDGPEDDTTEDDDDEAGKAQLNTMLNLLNTHEDKWWDAEGDARYEVELPDGSIETARTKDDVRALLFRNY